MQRKTSPTKAHPGIYITRNFRRQKGGWQKIKNSLSWYMSSAELSSRQSKFHSLRMAMFTCIFTYVFTSVLDIGMYIHSRLRHYTQLVKRRDRPLQLQSSDAVHSYHRRHCVRQSSSTNKHGLSVEKSHVKEYVTLFGNLTWYRYERYVRFVDFILLCWVVLFASRSCADSFTRHCAQNNISLST